MKVGTKSVLFGVHAFWLHPFLVALAWWRLYGFPKDWRLWLAFFVHDLGYWGAPNMDGPEGEQHVFLGGRVMARVILLVRGLQGRDEAQIFSEAMEWSNFCVYHSRFIAKREGMPFSRLCVADKYVAWLEPWWLYLPRAWLSGELSEYLANAGGKNNSKYKGEPNSPEVQSELNKNTARGWHKGFSTWCRDWVMEHRDGKQDDWTQSTAPPS